MYNCCTFDNFLSSVSIPKQDFVGQNVLMRQSSASMHAVSLSTFAVPQFSANDTADHCLSVDARLSTFYGNTSNPTHPIVSYPMVQASDSQSNYHKYENKLAVSSGGRVLETRGEDKGGVSNHGHRLQLKIAPALTYCSNLNKRKIDLPVEAPKIKRCRGSAKQNHKDEADNANEISKPDFIHVRARRGQATDSHSLAERARREKINERMRVLRDLVPGCYKATGKVVKQLDEIINYVQSLQNQVEILSMKLSAASRQYDSSVEVEKEPPPFGECGKTSVVPITFCEDAAPLNYSVTRSESLDRTCDSLIMGTTFADDVASGFGLMDANQWNVDLQGGFQDQHRIL